MVQLVDWYIIPTHLWDSLCIQVELLPVEHTAMSLIIPRYYFLSIFPYKFEILDGRNFGL